MRETVSPLSLSRSVYQKAFPEDTHEGLGSPLTLDPREEPGGPALPDLWGGDRLTLRPK